MKKFILAASLVLVSGSAFADHVWSNGGNGYYNDEGQKCDRHGNVKPPKNQSPPVSTGGSSSSTSGATATSGSTSSSNATGGSVNNSGNSTNTNTLNNKNTNKNTNTNTNTANGGTASVGNVSTGASTATASASGSGNGDNNTSINVAAAKIPVATAFANAPPTANPCLGSFGAGGQTAPIGLSFGGTKVDAHCVLEHDVALLHSMGLDEAACYRVRMGKEGKANDDALTEAGVDCKAFAAHTTADPTYVTQQELNNVIKKTQQK